MFLFLVLGSLAYRLEEDLGGSNEDVVSPGTISVETTSVVGTETVASTGCC